MANRGESNLTTLPLYRMGEIARSNREVAEMEEANALKIEVAGRKSAPAKIPNAWDFE